jgi:aminocarboxymuconate-semialdehyde decarboxylase
MSTSHRIDVHQHVLPPFYAMAIPTHAGDPSGGVTPHSRDGEAAANEENR